MKRFIYGLLLLPGLLFGQTKGSYGDYSKGNDYLKVDVDGTVDFLADAVFWVDMSEEYEQNIASNNLNLTDKKSSNDLVAFNVNNACFTAAPNWLTDNGAPVWDGPAANFTHVGFGDQPFTAGVWMRVNGNMYPPSSTYDIFGKNSATVTDPGWKVELRNDANEEIRVRLDDNSSAVGVDLEYPPVIADRVLFFWFRRNADDTWTLTEEVADSTFTSGVISRDLDDGGDMSAMVLSSGSATNTLIGDMIIWDEARTNEQMQAYFDGVKDQFLPEAGYMEFDENAYVWENFGSQQDGIGSNNWTTNGLWVLQGDTARHGFKAMRRDLTASTGINNTYVNFTPSGDVTYTSFYMKAGKDFDMTSGGRLVFVVAYDQSPFAACFQLEIRANGDNYNLVLYSYEDANTETLTTLTQAEIEEWVKWEIIYDASSTGSIAVEINDVNQYTSGTLDHADKVYDQFRFRTATVTNVTGQFYIDDFQISTTNTN